MTADHAALHAQLRARVAELRAVREAGTGGEWEASEPEFFWLISENLCDIEPFVAGGIREHDAALIVTAVNLFGPLLDVANSAVDLLAWLDEPPFNKFGCAQIDRLRAVLGVLCEVAA